MCCVLLKYFDMKEIYESWLKRTKHISCDCDYCGNKRYTLSHPIFTDRTRDHRATINACPACNFEDLQITQKVDYIPLHKFVLVKNGELDITELEHCT